MPSNLHTLFFSVFFLFTFLLSGCNPHAPAVDRQARVHFADTGERYIVQCQLSCDSVAAAVAAQGGRVLTRFRNVPALTVSLPAAAVAKVTNQPAIKGVVKDFPLGLPQIDKRVRGDRGRATANAQRERSIRQLIAGVDKTYNNLGTGAESLHKSGNTGKGVIVAVIDTGVADNADLVPVLAGSVIGGENFIDLPQEPSATSTKNDDHGTMVATLIAGHSSIALESDHPVAQAMQAYAADFVAPTESGVEIPVIGTAPESKLYALKVFPAQSEGGTSASVVLQAMDRAITLKRNFDAGGSTKPVTGQGTEDLPYAYDALNIQVVNLSLGGDVALYPGFEVDDLLTVEMINAGIVVTVAGGNEGPANLTIASPAAGYGALAVGAANVAVHDRVIRELLLGPGMGALMRPTDFTQMALFSSRGPLPDGRLGIHLATNGVGLLMQGAGGTLEVASGTSFSAPIVAGAAATLFSSGKSVNAAQVRAALFEGADPNKLGDASGAIAQGRGLLDMPAALAKLKSGALSTVPPKQPIPSKPARVADHLRKAGFPPVDLDSGGNFQADVTVTAGQVAQFMIPIPENAENMTVSVTEVVPMLPLEQQNAVTGDKLLLTIMDSARIAYPDYDELIDQDTEWTLSYPQPGLARVAVGGMRSNAGTIACKLHVAVTRRTLAAPIATGTMEDDESKQIRFSVPAATQQLIMELSWRTHWAFLPAHDIDMAIFDPAGNELLDEFGFGPGVTVRSPERVVIDNPAPGTWTARIDGYMLHGLEDRYELRVTDQNNKPLRRVVGAAR